MLIFTKLTLDDIDKLRPVLTQDSSKICNNTVGNVFMWRDYFSMEYALIDATAIFKAHAKYDDINTVFSIPLGKDFRRGVERVVEYCRISNLPIAFYAITDDDIEPLTSALSSVLGVSELKYRLHTNENWSDYVYEAHALKNLEGRKYSGKRNHINQFRKEYANWSFEEITSDNLPQIRDFYAAYTADTAFVTRTAIEDHNKTIEVLDNYQLYGLLGGALRVGNNIAAFSIGEIKNDVLHIHTEKADTRYKGVYQVINNEYAKHFATDDIQYINRAEDDGDLGIRFSKNSYHPCALISKYIYVVL